MRSFLRLGLEEAAPDHSTISRTRRVIRFSRSEVDLGDGPTTIAVGGLHTAAGLRLRF